MNDVQIQLVYIESVADETPFAWYDGKALTADQRAERAQIHREMADIVNGADLDMTAEWGRAVRCGNRLLVEVPLESTGDVTHRLSATIVISANQADTEWVDGAAREVSALLREYEFSMPVDRLTLAFTEGWRGKRRPFPRKLAAAGAVLVKAVCWALRALRLRSRRQPDEENTHPPSKPPTTMERR